MTQNFQFSYCEGSKLRISYNRKPIMEADIIKGSFHIIVIHAK